MPADVPDKPAKLQAAVSLVSADEPEQTYRWRIERKVPARLVYGIFEGLGRGQPPPKRLLTAYEGNAEKASKFQTLRLSRKDGKLRMEIADEYAPPDSGGWGACWDFVDWPAGAELVSAWRKHPATATETKYLVLWQGRFVRDAKTLSTMSFIVRLAGQDDPIMHIFGEGDQVEASEPLSALAIEGRPATRPAEEWGKPVDGVQVRLRCDRQRWHVDETITWKIDVRNTGKRHLTFAPHAYETVKIDVDGRIFSLPATHNAAISYDLKPGQEQTNIDFRVSRGWQLKDHPFQLERGKHTAKITLGVGPAKGESGGWLQVTSNPVDVEAVADNDRAAGGAEPHRDSKQLTVDLIHAEGNLRETPSIRLPAATAQSAAR